MIKTFVFKLYHSARNRYLHRQINAAVLTWNHCIALHKRYCRLFRKSLNLYQIQAHLEKIKYLPRFSYLLEYGSQAVQNVAKRINKAYQKFHANRKRGVKTSLPKFKRVRKYKSFTLKQSGWKLLDGSRIRINSRVYKFWKSREIEDKIKTLTIKRDAVGDIYIYLACEIDILEVKVRSGKSVGYGFRYFVEILKYIAAKFGSTIAQVDRFFASSQICHVCRYKNPEVKNIRIREWVCPQCHTKHTRDRNAAINIERQGVVSLGLGNVRPAFVGSPV